MGSSLEGGALSAEPSQVESTVPLLVGERRDEAFSQFAGCLRPAEECPREEFDGHQFVMSEPREAFRPCRGLSQFTRFR